MKMRFTHAENSHSVKLSVSAADCNWILQTNFARRASLFSQKRNAPVSIGSAMNGNAAYFKGVIDEVALYNYALSPSEVSSNFMAFELRATSLVAPRFSQSGPFFRFQLDRPVMSPYAIEVSTNLIDWSTTQLTSVTNSAGLFLVDTNVSAPYRFYRLRAH